MVVKTYECVARKLEREVEQKAEQVVAAAVEHEVVSREGFIVALTYGINAVYVQRHRLGCAQYSAEHRAVRPLGPQPLEVGEVELLLPGRRQPYLKNRRNETSRQQQPK